MIEDEVRLRPVEESDLAFLERIDKEPPLSEPFEWTGFRSPGNRRLRWEKDGYLGDGDSLLVVSLPDGTPAGIVLWKRAGGTASLGGCFEIGILLIPDHRGRGLGGVARPCSPITSSRPPWPTGLKLSPRLTTSPSEALCSGQGLGKRAHCEVALSSVVAGAMRSSTQGCEVTLHRRSAPKRTDVGYSPTLGTAPRPFCASDLGCIAWNNSTATRSLRTGGWRACDVHRAGAHVPKRQLARGVRCASIATGPFLCPVAFVGFSGLFAPKLWTSLSRCRAVPPPSRLHSGADEVPYRLGLGALSFGLGALPVGLGLGQSCHRR